MLRNPLKKEDTLTYYIEPNDTLLASDWVTALKTDLQNNKMLEKNYCFLGFPTSPRNRHFLVDEINRHIATINREAIEYHIDEVYTPENVWGEHETHGLNHDIMNTLHVHFERLQGAAWGLSDYYKQASYRGKYAIRQLNNLCHELESAILTEKKWNTLPYWSRPSQITTFLNATRYDLKDRHRDGFLTNGYDRELGGVYMHWTQIGKTLFEVFRDEGAPELTETVCETINELRYYSGEFDIEWANSVTLGGKNPWHNDEQMRFKDWLSQNGKDFNDKYLSLGYLKIGQVNLEKSFGTTNGEEIWKKMGNYLDIYKIIVGDVEATFDYCWSDLDHEQQQINKMRPGYDYSSGRM